MARRIKAMVQNDYRNGFQLTLQPQMLELPLRWRQPKRMFVNSLSDLFHVDVREYFIFDVFDVMRRASWRQFQVLTKRVLASGVNRIQVALGTQHLDGSQR